jgi:O-antigen/teichoic acid export membrane protein
MTAGAIVAFTLASRSLSNVRAADAAVAAAGGRGASGAASLSAAGAGVTGRIPDAATDVTGAAVEVSPLRRVTVSFGSMVRYSLPTAGSSLLNVLVTEADVLLLAAYVGRAPGVTAETFGVFAVAAQLAVGLRKVRQVFDPIFAPVVATRSISAHRGRLRETVAGPGRWVLSAQLPLVGVLLLSGGTILSIYGPEYRQGALWLGLLGVAHGTNAFAGLVETLLMIERPGLNLVNAAFTVAVQIGAGMLLIPVFGVTGAALAMCLGFAIQGALRFVELRHVYGWSWPWPSLIRPSAVFAVAFVPAAAFRVAAGSGAELVAGIGFLALYAAAWWMVGAAPADREIWRALVATRRRDSGLDRLATPQ